MRLNQSAHQLTGTPTGNDAETLCHRLAALIASLSETEQHAIITELAHASWIEPTLIVALCRLPVTVSAPLLMASPVLQASDLNQVLDDAGEDKALLIARRPNLPETVIDKLIDRASSSLCLTLLNNAQIQLTSEHLSRLGRLSVDLIALRAAVVRHPRLERSHAEAMLAFVGPRLRDELCQRYGSAAQSLPAHTPSDSMQTLSRLKHGDFTGFCEGLKRATGLPHAAIVSALSSESSVPLALMLVISGVDRAAFGDVLTQIQRLNKGQPQASPAHTRMIKSVFDLSVSEARARLTAILPTYA